MEDNNISAPMPQAKETQSPPDPAETTAGTAENLAGNGGGEGGGEGEAEENGVDGESGGVGPGEIIRRKRGTPREHQVGTPEFSASPVNNGQKRGRGRPPGTGKLQMLASLGELGETAGVNFTPYALTIQAGVDIAGILPSFAQKGSRSFCILSAVGCVSTVDICPSGYFDSGILRFEGRFELLSLTGSYTYTKMGNVRDKTGKLSVSLANPDGSVFGGMIVGSLIAAVPIQVWYIRKTYKRDGETYSGLFSSIYQLILGSFKQKSQLLRTHSAEPSTAIGSPRVSDRERTLTPIVNSENVGENSVVTPNGDGNTIGDHNLNHSFLQCSDQNGPKPSDHISDEKL